MAEVGGSLQVPQRPNLRSHANYNEYVCLHYLKSWGYQLSNIHHFWEIHRSQTLRTNECQLSTRAL